MRPARRKKRSPSCPSDRNGAAALAGVAEAAASLAAFLGATRVKLARTAPGALHAPLRRAIEHAAVAPAPAPVEDDDGDAPGEAEEAESELSVR